MPSSRQDAANSFASSLSLMRISVPRVVFSAGASVKRLSPLDVQLHASEPGRYDRELTTTSSATMNTE